MKVLAAFSIGLLMVGIGSGAPFINLDFEQADLTGSQFEYRGRGGAAVNGTRFPFGTGMVEKLLPGWHVFLDQSPTNIIAIGNNFITTTNYFARPNAYPNSAALLVEGDYLYDLILFGRGKPDGRYALGINNIVLVGDAGFTGFIGVSQTGDVPSNAKCLTYRLLSRGAEFTVVIDGSPFGYALASQSLQRDSSDLARVYVDISPWAGQTVKLSFATYESNYAIDTVEFYPEAGPLNYERILEAGDSPTQVKLTFALAFGYDHLIEYTDDLVRSPGFPWMIIWRPLPGGPHNSGTVTDAPSSGSASTGSGSRGGGEA